MSTGGSNTGLGSNSLYAVTTGSDNTGLGAASLGLLSTGSNNIALGSGSGSALTTGSYNIDIGNVGVAGESNTIRIGSVYSSPNGQNKTYIAGINGVAVSGNPVYVSSSGQLGVSLSSIRFKEDVQEMGEASSRIFGLRPVTFRYKKEHGGGGTQFGLIAEEVDQVIPEMTVRDKDGQIQTVAYQMLPPMLLNEVQKQQKVIGRLEAENGSLKAQLDELRAEVAEIRALLKK